ncbi:unnamed protein product [Amoebophrya sp. A25]|nr:unnamed protein product [Amoebophrya sp. A25]|eukprot:GSA25T00018614001.1
MPTNMSALEEPPPSAAVAQPDQSYTSPLATASSDNMIGVEVTPNRIKNAMSMPPEDEITPTKNANVSNRLALEVTPRGQDNTTRKAMQMAEEEQESDEQLLVAANMAVRAEEEALVRCKQAVIDQQERLRDVREMRNRLIAQMRERAQRIYSEQRRKSERRSSLSGREEGGFDHGRTSGGRSSRRGSKSPTFSGGGLPQQKGHVDRKPVTGVEGEGETVEWEMEQGGGGQHDFWNDSPNGSGGPEDEGQVYPGVGNSNSPNGRRGAPSLGFGTPAREFTLDSDSDPGDDAPADDFSALDFDTPLDAIGVAKCGRCGARLPLDTDAIEAHTIECEKNIVVNPSSGIVSSTYLGVVRHSIIQFLADKRRREPEPPQGDQRLFETWLRAFHSEFSDERFGRNLERLTEAFRGVWDETVSEVGIGPLGLDGPPKLGTPKQGSMGARASLDSDSTAAPPFVSFSPHIASPTSWRCGMQHVHVNPRQERFAEISPLKSRSVFACKQTRTTRPLGNGAYAEPEIGPAFCGRSRTMVRALDHRETRRAEPATTDEAM